MKKIISAFLIVIFAISFAHAGVMGGIFGGGDVAGPASSTDNAIARFHSTTGKILQNGLATIDDDGTIRVTGAIFSGSVSIGTTGQLRSTGSGSFKFSNDGGATWAEVGGVTVPTSFSVIASGTAATLSNAAPSAAMDFGTQDPSVTLTGAGSLPFWLEYHVRPNLAAATFDAVQNVQCWLYRTNNTPAEIPNTRRTVMIPIVTTTTLELTSISTGTAYTSSGTNDVLECRCQLSAAAGAGSVTALGASIEATGLLQ